MKHVDYVNPSEKTFGEKLPNTEYFHRHGAYLIAFNRECLHVVRGKTTGYLLPGGALEENETHEDCIRRECLEETGWDVEVKDYVCTADSYIIHERIGPFHPIQTYYHGTFTEEWIPPSDTDVIEHTLLPLTALDQLYSPMQRYAVELCIKNLHNDRFGYDREDIDF